MRYFLIVTAVLAALSSQAWAINKCTGEDGKVLYQDKPCGDSSKSAEQVKNSSKSEATLRATTWWFERKKHYKTGKVSCMAKSPISVAAAPGTAGKPTAVHAVLLASIGSEVISIQTIEDTDVFHTNISKVGMKADNGPFMPSTLQPGNRGMRLENNGEMIRALEKSKSLRVWARFWPYEQLHEMEPISLAGFDSALSQARECARRGQ